METERLFDFSAEFSGVLLSRPDDVDLLVRELDSDPISFVHCYQDIISMKVSIKIFDDNRFEATAKFVISAKDQESYWQNGGTSDLIAVWENDFPYGEMALILQGEHYPPSVAICENVR